MSLCVSFAEPDEPAADVPPESERDEQEGKVEDLAVGRLRLWLRGVFGGSPQSREKSSKRPEAISVRGS